MPGRWPHLIVEHPGLVSAHPVAADELDGAVGAGRIEAVVVGHDLLPLRVGEHLETRFWRLAGATAFIITTGVITHIRAKQVIKDVCNHDADCNSTTQQLYS